MSVARSDVVAKMFLPATLFTIHADLIARQMDEDLARCDCGPGECGWLSALNASLKEELAKSRRFGKIYPSLGFDPDYLMYGDALRGWRNRFFGGDYDNQYGFYMTYYLHMVRMHPERVAEKVMRQLGLFYLGEKHYFITSPRAELGARYTETVNALRMLMAKAQSYPAFNYYFQKCETLSSTHETISQSLTIRGLGGLLSVLYPAVFFCALGAVFFLRGDLRKLYGRFGAMTLSCFLITSGIVL